MLKLIQKIIELFRSIPRRMEAQRFGMPYKEWKFWDDDYKKKNKK